MRKSLVLLFICVAALSLFGLAVISSAVLMPPFRLSVHSHLVFLLAGLALMLLLSRVDYGWLQRRLSVLCLLVGICFVLLIAVLIPGVGIRLNGARRWLPGLGEPAEFAKPVVIILLAWYLALLDQEQIGSRITGFLIPMLLSGVPAFLIGVEPYLSTSLVLGLLTLGFLLVAGSPWKHLAIVGVVSLYLFLVFPNRQGVPGFLVFLNPNTYLLQGSGIWPGLIAFSNGGLWGRLLDGSMPKVGSIPEYLSDFVFIQIGQETGLLGTTIVLVLYLGILLCGLHIMKHARDRFGHFLAVGCATTITLQACTHIAATTSFFLRRSMPLPFISYGGSSLLAMFICAGLLGSVAWHSISTTDKNQEVIPFDSRVPHPTE